MDSPCLDADFRYLNKYLLNLLAEKGDGQFLMHYSICLTEKSVVFPRLTLLCAILCSIVKQCTALRLTCVLQNGKSR